MNTSPKDVSLFETFKDPDEASEKGLSVYLIETDTGKGIDQRMEEIRRWIPLNFDADKDPLWPKHGKVLDTALFESRHMGDEEFVLVWRDVAFTYYKRFGRGTYVSRALTDDEATQFIMELRGTLVEMASSQPAFDPQSKYKMAPPVDPATLTPEQAAKVEADKAEALAVIAIHDLDPVGFYTFKERRELMAVKLGYVPSYKEVASASDANDLMDILAEEKIPYERPGYWLSKEEMLAEMNEHYQAGVNVVIGEPTPEDKFEVTPHPDGTNAVLLHIEVPNVGPWRMLLGMVEADAWRIAYRRTFNREPVKAQQ
jgi:hypothetical protein